MNLKCLNTNLYSTLLFLLVTITLLIYLFWGGLRGPFLLDDYSNLGLMALLSEGSIELESFLFSGSTWFSSRPLSLLSFVGSQYITGESFSFDDSNTFYFKLHNLLIHLFIFLVIFRLIYKLSLITIGKQSALMLSVCASVLWLTSPMWISTVLYIVQRMAQLSTLFCLMGCLVYLEARLKNYNFSAIGLALICFGLGLLSKQNGVLLIPLIGLIELYLYLHSPSSCNKKHRFFSFSVIGVISFGLIAGVCFVLLQSERFLNYESYSFNLSERLLTQPRVLCDYILSSILPFRGGSLFLDDFPISTGIFQPFSTLISLVALCMLLIVGVWAIFRKSTALLGFGIIFFFIGHVLESTIIPLELYFEHRNYLPSVGLYIVIAFFISQLLIRQHHVLVWTILLSFVALNLYWLDAKAELWSSRDKLFAKEAQAHPDSLRLHKTLAVYFIKKQRIEEAAYHIEKTVEIHPGTAMGSTILLGAAFCALGIEPKNDGWVHHWKWENDEWEAVAGGLDILQDVLSEKKCSGDIVVPLIIRLAEEIKFWRLGEAPGNIPTGLYMRMGYFALLIEEHTIAEEMSKIACAKRRMTLECLTLARVFLAQGREADIKELIQSIEGAKDYPLWQMQVEAFKSDFSERFGQD